MRKTSMPFIRTALLFLSILFAVSLYAQEKYYPPKTPWHLADVWWEAQAPINNFTEATIDFEIIGKVSPDNLLYIAPMGLSKLNDIPFYGGVQTSVSGWKSKDSRILLALGKGGIFSRWSSNKTPIGLEFAQGDEHTYYHSGGYEGEFVSVRKKFEWDEGKYQYRLKKLNTITNQEGVYTWFGAYVYDYANNKEHFIGALKFEGSSFVYGKKHAAFVEIYGTLKRSKIPSVTVIFDRPKINGVALNTLQTRVSYPKMNKNIPLNPQFAYSQIEENKVLVMTIPSGMQPLK
jgi:hypothetical protein